MNPNSQSEQELEQLLGKAVDGSLEPSEAQRIEELVSGNPERLQFYRSYMEIDVLLEAEAVISSGEGASSVSNRSKESTERSALFNGLFSKVQWSLLSLAAVILVSILGGWYFFSYSHSQVVAIVEHLDDPAWGKGQRGYETQSAVYAGRKISLDSGLLGLKMASGVSVTVAGPVECVVSESNRVSLLSGKLVARVPEEAVGFTVDTPVTQVVDLGTVFGVDVGINGEADIAVFEGVVEASVAENGGDENASNTVLIHAGSGGHIGTKRSFEGQLFALKSSPLALSFRDLLGLRLNVSDMIAGGDGTGDTRGRGLDPTTGQFVEVETIDHLIEHEGPTFHYVDESPWISGVFVPGGDRGEVVIDPAGRRFASSRLSGDESFGPFWSGAPAPIRTNPGMQGENRMLAELGGIDYGSSAHSIVFFHPNKGITFDLKAFREAYPGMHIDRFSALLGNTEKSDETRPKDRRQVFMAADFWVVVDGKTRYERLNFNRDSGIEQIQVSIPAKARYLTLIAGNGPAKTILDWVILVDPIIHLESRH